MIIGESQILTKGIHYTVGIECIATRKSTAIERLLLKSIVKSKTSRSMNDLSIKYIFEEILQIQNSELLIYPCLKNLSALDVIKVESNMLNNYNEIKLSNIYLTDSGKKMFEEGLLPGEKSEMSIDVYYNPLTNTVTGKPTTKNLKVDYVPLEMDTLHINFPKETILNGLNSNIFSMFNASKYKVLEIRELAKDDWSNCISSISVDLTENKISTTPKIDNTILNKNIEKILSIFEIQDVIPSNYDYLPSSQMNNIVGYGSKIKSELISIVRNGKYIFMDADYFKRFIKSLKLFKNKIFILFNAPYFKIEKIDEFVCMSIPDSFIKKNCMAINDLNQNLCLSRCTANYKETKVNFINGYNEPQDSDFLKEWIEKVVNNNYRKDIRYYSLLTLKPYNSITEHDAFDLSNYFNMVNASNIANKLKELYVSCVLLESNFVNIQPLSSLIVDKLINLKSSSQLETIKILFTLPIEEYLLKELLNVIFEKNSPKTYEDVLRIYDVLDIHDIEDAKQYVEYEERIYNRNVITSILQDIITNKFSQLLELNDIERFFNEYVNCINNVELLINHHSLFNSIDFSKYEMDIINCPNIATLKSNISQIRAMQGELVSIDINSYEEMAKVDKIATDYFYENLRIIDNYTNDTIKGELVKRNFITEQNVKIDKKIYIVDTCAMINNQNLFLYFAEDEYVRIPSKAWAELGNIKDRQLKKYGDGKEVPLIARALAKDIKNTYLTSFNTKNNIRFMIENGDENLLPFDLDKETPDHIILSVALKYKNWDVTLITDDVQFSGLAYSQNINSVSSNEFIKEHRKYYLSKEEHRNIVMQQNRKKIKTSKVDDQLVTNSTNKYDDYDIKELKKYLQLLNDNVITFLKNNKIKTIGDLRLCTSSKIKKIKTKGQNTILKENVLKILDDIDDAIDSLDKDMI